MRPESIPRITVWLVLILAASCTSQYEFPDYVPTRAQRWIDPPLQAEIHRAQTDLATTLETSLPGLEAVACRQEEKAIERGVFRNARGLVEASVHVARKVSSLAAAAQDPSQIKLGISLSAEPEPFADYLNCRPSLSEACRRAAASEAAGALYLQRLHILPPNAQPAVLDLLISDLEWTTAVVSEAPDMEIGFGEAKRRCEAGEGPIPQFLARPPRSNSEPEGADENVVTALRSLLGADVHLCQNLASMHLDLVAQLEAALHKRARGQVTCDE